MPRKRRKLNPELESHISDAQRKVELITAIINDIEDEEIQLEYKSAFDQVKLTFIALFNGYKLTGYTEETASLYSIYKKLIDSFESEYEI